MNSTTSLYWNKILFLCQTWEFGSGSDVLRWRRRWRLESSSASSDVTAPLSDAGRICAIANAWVWYAMRIPPSDPFTPQDSSSMWLPLERAAPFGWAPSTASWNANYLGYSSSLSLLIMDFYEIIFSRHNLIHVLNLTFLMIYQCYPNEWTTSQGEEGLL